jgi:hypothetical protein
MQVTICIILRSLLFQSDGVMPAGALLPRGTVSALGLRYFLAGPPPTEALIAILDGLATSPDGVQITQTSPSIATGPSTLDRLTGALDEELQRRARDR